jgi:orotate phosphoribosyltransferase
MNVLKELDAAGAVLLGKHFVYTSGKHGPDFVRIDALLSDDDLFNRICRELVQSYADYEVEAVTACKDDRCNKLAYISAEHLGVEAGSGESLGGKRTLVVEDVLTTGGSVADICSEATLFGAYVIGASVICNRGGVTPEQLGVARLDTLVTVSMDAFNPEDCGLCANEIPIVDDVGRGATFKQNNPDHAGGYESLLAA